MATTCNKCGKETAPKRCSRCRSVRYCSVECQRADWPTHKVNCKPAPEPSTVAAAPLENFDAIDVAIVVGQAEVDQKTASEALRKTNGDVQKAIESVTQA